MFAYTHKILFMYRIQAAFINRSANIRRLWSECSTKGHTLHSPFCVPEAIFTRLMKRFFLFLNGENRHSSPTYESDPLYFDEARVHRFSIPSMKTRRYFVFRSFLAWDLGLKICFEKMIILLSECAVSVTRIIYRINFQIQS